MPSDGDSFLPRIQSVFYAVFDIRQGPKLVYQVPEGLIASGSLNTNVPYSPSTPSAQPGTPSIEFDSLPFMGRHSPSLTVVTPLPTQALKPGKPSPRSFISPPKRSSSTSRTLFHFDEVSRYVIPPSALCGRLLKFATKRHRVVGFPVELHGDYPRNYFRYNLCFVFERTADLSCYEPVVRKIARVLTSCEEESSFLSSPNTSREIHTILEQLYEDLNSYSETSIAIDRFNSIELKILPFYPNPPPVKDWMVPLALINLNKRIEPNWDLTIAQVCKHIDGINHVSRIAYLADCDLELAREAIAHLLYYQVIMTIDIFQYSNMYTLQKSVQWLADEVHVRKECGPYVTKPDWPIPDWPTLLRLYSRLKPGKTVLEWMDTHHVQELGLDIRRFTSFGVIKGFLRRVHRYPILLESPTAPSPDNALSSNNLSPIHRKRGKSLSMTAASLALTEAALSFSDPESTNRHRGSRLPEVAPVNANAQITSPVNEVPPPVLSGGVVTSSDVSPFRPVGYRKSSAAEQVLESLKQRGLQKAPMMPSVVQSPQLPTLVPKEVSTITAAATQHNTRRNSILSTFASSDTNSVLSSTRPRQGTTSSTTMGTMPLSSNNTMAQAATTTTTNQGILLSTPPTPTLTYQQRPRIPSEQLNVNIKDITTAAAIENGVQGSMPGSTTSPVLQPLYPPELVSLLDGEHHTDELATMFNVGWPMLREWLKMIGNESGDDDNFGNVVIICR